MPNISLNAGNRSKKAYIQDIGIERRKSSASEENEAIYFVLRKVA